MNGQSGSGTFLPLPQKFTACASTFLVTRVQAAASKKTKKNKQKIRDAAIRLRYYAI